MKNLSTPLFALLMIFALVGNAFAQAKPTKKAAPKAAKTATKTTKTADSSKEKPKKASTATKIAAPMPFKPRLAYIMGSVANTRAQPNTKAEILVKLATGSEVTVLADGGAPLTIEGVKSNWYKVRFRKDTAFAEGFIWGGYLSDLEKESARDKGTQFLVRRNSDNELLVQAAFQGRLLYSLKVPTQGCTGLNARTATGWDRIHDAIVLQTSCKDKTMEDLIIWSSGKLYVAAPSITSSKFGADPFHEEHWIIEAQKGAVRDGILKEKTDRVDWNKTTYLHAQTEIVPYEWNGTELMAK